jgi:hypothetical protein
MLKLPSLCSHCALRVLLLYHCPHRVLLSMYRVVDVLHPAKKLCSLSDVVILGQPF